MLRTAATGCGGGTQHRLCQEMYPGMAQAKGAMVWDEWARSPSVLRGSRVGGPGFSLLRLLDTGDVGLKQKTFAAAVSHCFFFPHSSAIEIRRFPALGEAIFAQPRVIFTLQPRTTTQWRASVDRAAGCTVRGIRCVLPTI